MASRTVLRVGVVCLILAVLTTFAGLSVSAHAVVARSTPAADSVLQQTPERISIWFTEPLVANFSSIQVLDASGSRVDNGDSSPDATDPTLLSVTVKPLERGIYTVTWRNVSNVD